MPKKRIDPNKTHGYIGDKPKSKTVPKPVVEPEWLSAYKEQRNKTFTDPKTLEEWKNL